MPFTPNDSEQRSRLTCYRGCWHVISRRLFPPYSHARGFPLPAPFLGRQRTLQPSGLRRPRGVAPSRFRALRNILSCCLPQESGPYLSPNVPVRPLRPGTRHSHGGPLPRRPADGTRTAPPAGHTAPFPPRLRRGGAHPVLPRVSTGCPRRGGASSTRYSPVRRSRGGRGPRCRPTCMLKTRRQRSF